MVKIGIVLGFILFDIVTGFLIAVFTRKVSSQKMRKGLLNKIGELLAVIVAKWIMFVSPFIGLNLQYDIMTPVAMYICIMEAWSILENILTMSPKLKNVIIKEEIKNDTK